MMPAAPGLWAYAMTVAAGKMNGPAACSWISRLRWRGRKGDTPGGTHL